MTKQTKVFEVAFRCSNCGHAWFEQFNRGDRVQSSWAGIFLHTADCANSLGCRACRTVGCPVCGAGQDISIVTRHPIDGPTSKPLLWSSWQAWRKETNALLGTIQERLVDLEEQRVREVKLRELLSPFAELEKELVGTSSDLVVEIYDLDDYHRGRQKVSKVMSITVFRDAARALLDPSE